METEIKACDYCGTKIKGQGLIYMLPEKQETLCMACFVKVFIRDAAKKESRHIHPTVPTEHNIKLTKEDSMEITTGLEHYICYVNDNPYPNRDAVISNLKRLIGIFEGHEKK